MDPNACWKRLLEAIVDGDTDEARDAAEDLTEWVAKGASVPPFLQQALQDTKKVEVVNCPPKGR